MMKTNHIIVIALSLLMAQLAQAVSFNVINHTGKNILILPERSELYEYEILKSGQSMKLSATFHSIKTLRWAVKNDNGTWNIYTATIDLPLSPLTYGDVMIHPKGIYVNQLHKNKVSSDEQAMAQIIFDKDNIWPQRINEGIFTNN